MVVKAIVGEAGVKQGEHLVCCGGGASSHQHFWKTVRLGSGLFLRQ